MLDADGFITLSKSVALRPYVPRPPKAYELMNDDEIRANVGDTLIVDIESYLNYFLIAFKHIKTGKIITFEPPFNQFKLSWIMHNYVTVGFNSIKYDLLMLWYAYVGATTEELQELSKRIIFSDVRSPDMQKEYGFQVHPTRHIDLIEVCPLKGSLKLYGARLHSPRIQDLPFSIYTPLEPWQIPVVKDYCVNDLDETERNFKFLKDRLDLRASLTIQYRDDLMSKSDAQIAEAIISKEIYKLSGRWPKRPEPDPDAVYHYKVPDYIRYKTPALQNMLEEIKKASFTDNGFGYVDLPPNISKVGIPVGNGVYRMGIGGLHSSEKCVGYKATDTMAIIDRDVASYYPRIILTLGLYPIHLGLYFLEVYQNLVDRRLEAKKTKNIAEDKGLKVATNGTFGKTSNKYSIMYSLEMFIHIVITGQLALLLQIEMIEEIGVRVISANTDGIVMLCPQHLESRLAETIAEWERLTGFTTEETRYKSYYARDVNAYFAVKLDGTVKVKGPYSEVGSATGTQLDNNPASLICSDAVQSLLSKGIPIEKTIYECQDIRRFVTVRNVKGGAHKDGYYLGKVIRWYYSNRCSGTINYISNGNKVPDTDNAMPAMDLPETFPSDLDHGWYIRRTNEILEEIAYKPRKEQLKFF